MKNIYQLFPEQEEKKSVLINLRYSQKVLLDFSEKKPFNSEDLIFIGFMILSFAEKQGVSANQEINIENIAKLSADYQMRAIKAAGRKRSHLDLSQNDDAVNEKLDLLYARKLIGTWRKNEKIAPNDALYIGFMLHSICQRSYGKNIEDYINPAKMNTLAQSFFDKAIQSNQLA